MEAPTTFLNTAIKEIFKCLDHIIAIAIIVAVIVIIAFVFLGILVMKEIAKS